MHAKDHIKRAEHYLDAAGDIGVPAVVQEAAAALAQAHIAIAALKQRYAGLEDD